MPVETLGIKELHKKQMQQPKMIEEEKIDPLLTAFKAISRVLAVRLFLFLSLIGAFVLSLIAIHDKDSASLYVLIAYSFLTTGPLVLLEWKGKKGG